MNTCNTPHVTACGEAGHAASGILRDRFDASLSRGVHMDEQRREWPGMQLSGEDRTIVISMMHDRERCGVEGI
jgi:hypothetical protein